ncbi:MAG: GNAT family N-acetyltransferase [Acidobacteriota bacterium]
MVDFRLLTPADTASLEAFLVLNRDTSMFLRSNARRAGLTYAGRPLQAVYAGAFIEGRVVGVVAHCWNGMMLVQAPEHASGLARACIEWSGRPVTGLAGLPAQVRAARSALALQDAATNVDSDEWLYGLDIANLIVPDALATGAVTCRPPRSEERDQLCAWRLAYDVEVMGASDTPETRERSTAFLDAQLADGNAWVAVVDRQLVSLSAFNASLPDIVQLGGIYTPPQHRSRGYARAAVAASLLAARARGVSRAVLFTPNPHAARAYESVGFRLEGDYALVFFRQVSAS